MIKNYTTKEVGIMKCSKHAEYAGDSVPTSKCKQCRMLYVLKHRDKTCVELASELGINEKTVRNYETELGLPNRIANVQSNRNDVPFEVQLLKMLKSKRTKKVSIVDIANYFGKSPAIIKLAMEKLADEDRIAIDSFPEGQVQLAGNLQPIETPRVIDTTKYKETEFCFGVTGDNHLGSKYERNDVLNALFDKFEEAGVTTVYQCGNMIDGEARFNKYDIYVHGVEAQVANFIQKWPQRKGIVTEFVTGDDHEGWYVQREHINIGQKIEDEAIRAGRDDLKFIGHMERDIIFQKPKGSSRIRVIHAGGGSSYAISYTSQKYVESLQGGEKPDMVLIGHFHKFDWSFPREVHCIQPGSTMDQTPFMRKKRLQSVIGGCIVWVKQNELGIFTSVKVEWLPFFDQKFYKYRW